MKNSTYVPAFLLSALISLPSATVYAGGPLDLNPNDPDGVERWANGGQNIPFNVDLGDLGPLSNAEASALTEAAFQIWDDIPSATATYSNNGALPFDVDETNFAPFVDNLFNGNNNSDGLSPIVYDADGAIFDILFGPGSGILGFATADTRDANGVPIEGVSFLNGGAISGGFPVDDFFGVQVHEFGHYSGLAHTVTNGETIAQGDGSGPASSDVFGAAPSDQVETMYPFAIVGGGEETLHRDEIGIFSFLYPEPDFISSTVTITGQIFDTDGTTLLTGVNVIARNVNDPFVDANSDISGSRGENGRFTINGLTPGEDYAIFVDEIIDGGFSTTPIMLTGPEEFFNDGLESNDGSTDDPTEFTTVSGAAGDLISDINIVLNGAIIMPPGEDGVLALGDDDSIEVGLPFQFQICGQSFGSVFVNSNGNVTFGSENTDFSESVAELLSGAPRIAPLWDDLDPTSGGQVSVSSFNNRFVISYENVPEFGSTEGNTFAIELREVRNINRGSRFTVTYGDLGSTDAIAGFSCGAAVTSGTEQGVNFSDLNTSNIPTGQRTAVFELFDAGNPVDLADESLGFRRTTRFLDVFENNNDLNQARRISLPFSSANNRRFTAISPAGNDVDYFNFRGRAGDLLVAEIVAGPQVDTVLGLFDAAGNLIASDDDGGTGNLSRLIVQLPDRGNYFLAVSAFPDTDFTGDGATSGRYVLDVNRFAGSEAIILGDDDSAEVTFDFDFPFQGQDWNSVFVNSNGNLTFGAGDTSFAESVTTLLAGAPRIAALWDDLNPTAGGLVLLRRLRNGVDITFRGIPEFGTTNNNTFRIGLRRNGRVFISYQNIDSEDSLIGISQGNGAEDPGASDISTLRGFLPASGTLYELFDATSPFDIADDRIRFDD